MTYAERLAQFVVRSSFDSLSNAARLQLKIRVLDALGCAIGAMGGPPVTLIRKHLEDFGGQPLVTLIGGNKTAPDRAAFYNSALIRYLDFNDSYLAKGETCHPSDTIGAVLATAEYAGRSGKEFLTALAVAYQVLCRLCDLAPVRARGSIIRLLAPSRSPRASRGRSDSIPPRPPMPSRSAAPPSTL